MRNGLLGCVAILVGVGVAAAQPAGPMPAMPFVMVPPPGAPHYTPQAGTPYVQPPMPMTYGPPPGMGYYPPQAGMGYGPPPGMGYGPSQGPGVPFVMPPPPGMPYAPSPQPSMPFVLPPGAPVPTLPPPAPDVQPGSDDRHEATEEESERPHECEHFWVDAGLLVWWVKGAQTPPLLTSGSAADPVPGALGQRGTQTLYGGDHRFDALPGGRLDFGFWTAENYGYLFGLEGNVFFLDRGATTFSASSTGTPVLAQPFRNVTTNAETAALLAFPGVQSGQFTASLSNRLWGAEVGTRTESVDTGVIHIYGLTGLRYLEFRENLGVAESTTFGAVNPLLGGLSIRQSDSFGTGNFFYGLDVGADGTAEFGPLSLRLMGKIAFGDTHENAAVSGASTLTTPLGGTTTIRSGFLALPTNSGRFAREKFTVVPEGEVAVGYALTKHIRASLGYDLLYASAVLRPGDLVDHNSNSSQIPPPLGPGRLVGAPRPAFAFQGTDFWAQGLNLDLEIRY